MSFNITLKRIKGELKLLEKNREPFYQVIQDEKNELDFYFLIRGDSSSAYNGGYYIGKIALPPDYPQKPGDFYMLTPSGRFAIDKKICLTNSGYHRENWTPMWNITNMVVAFISIFTADDTDGVSHIRETTESRQNKARTSLDYNLEHYGDICVKFTQFFKPDRTIRTDEEIISYIQEHKAKKPNKN